MLEDSREPGVSQREFFAEARFRVGFDDSRPKLLGWYVHEQLVSGLGSASGYSGVAVHAVSAEGLTRVKTNRGFAADFCDRRKLVRGAVEEARNAAIILVHRDDDAALSGVRSSREHAEHVVSFELVSDDGVIVGDEQFTERAMDDGLSYACPVRLIRRTEFTAEAAFGRAGECEDAGVGLEVLDQDFELVGQRVLALGKVSVKSPQVVAPMNRFLGGESDLINEHVTVDE